MDIGKVLTKLGFSQLNEMQQAVGKAIADSDRDVVVLSPTGSGKTLAYLLPLLQCLDAGNDALQMVVIVPGRELALQSVTVMRDMGCGLRAMSVYGGRPAMDEHREMRRIRPQVLFATPGRLNDHIEKGNVDTAGVAFLVIDEFDKCLAMGFHDEMRKVMDYLTAVRRRVLLSATNADTIPHFVNMRHTEWVDFLDKSQVVTRRVSVYVVNSPEKDKLHTLARLLRELGEASSIVFLNFRDSVERTDQFLRQQGFTTSAFHGGLAQEEREEALYRFSNGSANVLVATDLASRGLDIPDVANIIHYHLPLGQEEYVHRVGRTARWQALGAAYFILSPEETLPDYVGEVTDEHVIPDTLPMPASPRMATVYIGKGKKDKISKGDIVGFLCKIGGLDKTEVGRIDVYDRYAYAAVARERLRMVLENTKGQKIKGIRTVVEPLR